MTIEVEIQDAEGNRQFYESAENIAANTKFGLERAWYFVGKDLISEFNKQVLAKDKKGRIYFRRTAGGIRRKHQASAPGQTPANRTGNYRRGIGFNVNGWKQLRFGNSTEYAGFLEIGTSRMKKRPGLGNTVKSAERDTIRNLSEDIEQEI